MRSCVAVFVIAAAIGGFAMKARANDRLLKGYGISETGLTPLYPEGYKCSPLTSLYASWTDVDGSKRDEPHSGVDGGRLGEPLLAPGPGMVVAAWLADWGWGDEGALLIQHSRLDLNLTSGSPYYYSAFYHLHYDDVAHYRPGQKIARGQELARIFRPGGKKRYLPEVHWEVWETGPAITLKWTENKYGRADWIDHTAALIDPLYLLSRETPPDEGLRVAIAPFEAGRDYARFRGFTYILPCERKG